MKTFLLFILIGFTCVLGAHKAKRAAYDLPDAIGLLLAPLRTTFVCTSDGYFADQDNNCQIFHVCHTVTYPNDKTETFQYSFICGNLTIFNQRTFTCTYPEDAVPCERANEYYGLNDAIGDPNAVFQDGEGGTGGNRGRGGSGGFRNPGDSGVSRFGGSGQDGAGNPGQRGGPEGGGLGGNLGARGGQPGVGGPYGSIDPRTRNAGLSQGGGAGGVGGSGPGSGNGRFGGSGLRGGPGVGGGQGGRGGVGGNNQLGGPGGRGGVGGSGGRGGVGGNNQLGGPGGRGGVGGSGGRNGVGGNNQLGGPGGRGGVGGSGGRGGVGGNNQLGGPGGEGPDGIALTRLKAAVKKQLETAIKESDKEFKNLEKQIDILIETDNRPELRKLRVKVLRYKEKVRDLISQIRSLDWEDGDVVSLRGGAENLDRRADELIAKIDNHLNS